MNNDKSAENGEEDRMSGSVFLPDIFQLRDDRHELLSSDKILLVWNKAKYDKNGELVRRAGVGMPGGHVDPGEHYLDAIPRELTEETGINLESQQAVILNHRKLFLEEEGEDKEKEREYDEKGYLKIKIHWHLTVVGRLLVPVDKIVISIGKPGIKKAEWCRLDRLPSGPLGLYTSHIKRIKFFQNRLKDRELFDYVFK